MIDFHSEELIPLSAVPKLKAFASLRQGRRLSLSTVWRWANYGIGGRKLETIKLGGQRCTSMAALQRFVNVDDKDGQRRPSSKSPMSKMQNNKSVEQALDAIGI